MGCSTSHALDNNDKLKKVKFEVALKSAVIIQKWFRRYQARLETRRRCTWKIFESIEYNEEQDQQNLYNFFNEMVDKVNSDGLVSKFRDVLGSQSSKPAESETETKTIMRDIEKSYVPAEYAGPRVELPLTLETTKSIVEHFKKRNASDIHGKFDDLLTVFHKNGLPSSDNPYIFNGDFVDRGQRSVEDDAGMIKDLCRSLFTWLPLATTIGNKLFVVHGGISDKTDLDVIKQIKRHQFASVLKPSHISLTDDVPPKLEEIVEWEQILDLLWSDPKKDAGRGFNHTRGGGCLFGPDITDEFLQRNNMDLIIRSHECKYEGFEYTHNNKVITIFSASNYYAMGSNFGAYLKIGSDAKPFPVQFSVTPEKRLLSLKQTIGVNEQSAVRDLRERFFYHREELLAMFHKYDTNNNGAITTSEWANCMESVLKLKLPWTTLRHKLVAQDEHGNALYMSCLEGYEFNSAVPQQLRSISEVLYRNRSSLETVFRLIDKDCSGFITLDEFRHSCEVLNQLSANQIPLHKFDDLAKSLDINQDGKIDFNEFLEAFRLVSQSVEPSEDA
eukprot:gene7362-8182_t